MIKLSEEEIRKRMKQLHNYEKIRYPQLKERSDRLRKEMKALKKENQQLREENKQVQKILLELEEMREIMYGKKQKEHKRKKVVVAQ